MSRRVLLLMMMACAPPEYGEGPEVYSEPTLHIGDSWIFSPTRINRIDLELGEDAVDILRSERGFSYPRNKVRASATITSIHRVNWFTIDTNAHSEARASS